MVEDTAPYERFGECAANECEERCPWDMSAIILNDDLVCCSPDCARDVLDWIRPEKVTLHDPQYHTDRNGLGVSEEEIQIESRVEDREDAEIAIDIIEERHSVFRPTVKN